MGLKAFFRESAKQPENLKIIISDRFPGEDGVPERWELRSLTETENSAIKESCTKKVVGKGGRMTTTFDGELYMKRMVAKSVVHPALDDAELQGSWGVVGEVELLNTMLLPGEMTLLEETVRQLNGYDAERLTKDIDEVKN